MTCQKIEVYEHQICNISLRIPGQNIGDWLCYGSAIRKGYQDCLHFNIEADTEKNLFNITIPSIDIKSPALKFELHEYQIFLKNILTRQEFAVLTGDILVNKRTCTHDAQESVSSTPIELEATVSGNILDVAVNIAGGLSAYEIAKLHGFSGTEEDWILELQGAADAANDAKQSRESAQLSLTTTLQAQDKAQEEAQKSERFKNEALGYSQSAASSANNAQIFAETAQAAAEAAEQKRAEAEAAASAANSLKIAAEKYENNAKESKEAAISSQLAAEQAKQDAQAAQSKAEQEAAIATKAAEDAQAPESIAAQSARPATMLLVKDELMSILGDARLFDLDTDGQKIIVHTDRLADEQLAAVTDMLERFVPQFIEVVRYNHNMEVSWRDINKYAECTSKADMLAVNPDYINDLTSDGSWVYPLPGMVDVREPVFTGSPMKHFRGSLPNLKVAGEGYNGGLLQGLNLISFECELPVLEQEAYSFIDSRSMKEWNIELPMLRSAFQMFRWSSMTEWHIELPNLKKGHCMFGNSKMEDFKVGLPSLSDGSYFFESCQINKESALRVLNSIPAYTSGKHPLHIGIHVDHQADEEVLAAIDAATAKGWTVSVQWNGTATASTFALRPAPPLPVYAKIDTFTDEAGTEHRSLSWCHQITSPDGREPEEMGYTLFESVEAAREYFGLPEEPLTNN